LIHKLLIGKNRSGPEETISFSTRIPTLPTERLDGFIRVAWVEVPGFFWSDVQRQIPDQYQFARERLEEFDFVPGVRRRLWPSHDLAVSTQALLAPLWRERQLEVPQLFFCPAAA